MPSPRVSAWLVKGWRLAALLLAALLLQRTTPVTESALTRLGLDDAKAFFPGAKRLKSGPSQTLLVQDQHGNRLGRLVTTSPDADSILGYAGPSNVLVALDNQDKVVGTRILASEDTPEHVDTLRGNAAFEKAFKDWRPTTQPAPKLDGYAGSTLTAYAITESIQKRLSGNYVSLRFPTPLSLKEIQGAGFPAATGFEPNVPRLGWNLVRGPNRAPRPPPTRPSATRARARRSSPSRRTASASARSCCGRPTTPPTMSAASRNRSRIRRAAPSSRT